MAEQRNYSPVADPNEEVRSWVLLLSTQQNQPAAFWSGWPLLLKPHKVVREYLEFLRLAWVTHVNVLNVSHVLNNRFQSSVFKIHLFIRLKCVLIDDESHWKKLFC